MLLLWLDNNTSLHSRRVLVLVAIKLTQQQSKKSGSQMDSARETNELTAGFWACFYPVRQLSVRGAPALG